MDKAIKVILAFLFFLCLADMPYGYYQFVRFAGLVGFTILAYQVNCGLVYEIYFPEEIKSAGKEILKHLGDLKPITDEMSEEKKLAIIQSEFERLYDPNHPVRFAIETLDSVEEVRIIKEALK